MEANALTVDSPATLPIRAPQPHPTETLISHIEAGPYTFTPITRVWPEGGVLDCGLCPKGQCSASYCDDSRTTACCQVVALRHVSREEAPLFRNAVRAVSDVVHDDHVPQRNRAGAGH